MNEIKKLEYQMLFYLLILIIFGLLLFSVSQRMTIVMKQNEAIGKDIEIASLKRDLIRVSQKNVEYRKIYSSVGIGGYYESGKAPVKNSNESIEYFIKNYNLNKYEKRFDDYQWPVKNPEQSYTWRWDCEFTKRNYMNWFHNAIDLVSAYALNVLASKQGTVIETHQMERPEMDVYEARKQNEWLGNYIIIQHEDGKQTLYAHLSVIEVEEGDAVDQGENIGFIGNTGNSFGFHLHFEIYEIVGKYKKSYNFVTNSIHKRKVLLDNTKYKGQL